MIKTAMLPKIIQYIEIMFFGLSFASFQEFGMNFMCQDTPSSALVSVMFQTLLIYP